MDIVLEVFDTLVFDGLYATILPSSTFQESIAGATRLTQNSISFLGEGSPPTCWLQAANHHVLFQPTEYACLSRLPRDNVFRQALSLFAITWLFGLVTYFGCAGFSYLFIFDKTLCNHPKFMKNQMRLEIHQASKAMPWIAVLTMPWFLAEVRGFSRIYDTLPESSPWYMGGWYSLLQLPFFVAFTDFGIYWIHQGLHHPRIYKHLHKIHHKWIMPTPFASHSFHPLDGYFQSLPYHIFPFLFPLQNYTYLGLFAFVNIWTVSIHDSEYLATGSFVNGAACHTIHHLYFNYNYGQFTTLWDRVGGSYRKPNDELFEKAGKRDGAEWRRQVAETERLSRLVDGKED